jgi:hypothetical protein
VNPNESLRINGYGHGDILIQKEDSNKLSFKEKMGVGLSIFQDLKNIACFEPYTEPTEVLYEGSAEFWYCDKDYTKKPLLHCHDDYYLGYTLRDNAYVLASWKGYELLRHSKITCEPIEEEDDLTGQWLVVYSTESHPDLCHKGKETVYYKNGLQHTTIKNALYKLKFHV